MTFTTKKPKGFASWPKARRKAWNRAHWAASPGANRTKAKAHGTVSNRAETWALASGLSGNDALSATQQALMRRAADSLRRGLRSRLVSDFAEDACASDSLPKAKALAAFNRVCTSLGLPRTKAKDHRKASKASKGPTLRQMGPVWGWAEGMSGNHALTALERADMSSIAAGLKSWILRRLPPGETWRDVESDYSDDVSNGDGMPRAALLPEHRKVLAFAQRHQLVDV